MSVEVNHITKKYGSQKALDDVSLSVKRGELLGFLGPNGAGKSTLMKVITGFLPADSGNIFINGTRVTTGHVQIRRDIGYLPENNPLYDDLYVTEYLSFVAGVYKLPQRKARVSEMIEMTGLEREWRKKIGQLSKGYRQRVGLAQALIHDPSVLILDEPTTGLDPNQLTEIRRLIGEISREKTVILSSHILQEIEAICRRIVIIDQGAVVADMPIGELTGPSASDARQVRVVFDKQPDPLSLAQIPGVSGIIPSGPGWLITSGQNIDVRPEIFRFAVNNQMVILEMTTNQQNLEKIFRQLTHSGSSI